MKNNNKASIPPERPWLPRPEEMEAKPGKWQRRPKAWGESGKIRIRKRKSFL